MIDRRISTVYYEKERLLKHAFPGLGQHDQEFNNDVNGKYVNEGLHD